MPDLERSEDQFDGFDCVSKEYNMFIELKSRRTHYDTLLMEKKKYDFLRDTATAMGLHPYYINSTPNGVYQFPILELDDLVWEEKWLPVTTDFANKNKIMKMVTFLPIEKGIKID